MKIFRIALFLGVLSSTLIGCDDGEKKTHTITFAGTNCVMKEGEESVKSVTIEDGGSKTFTIVVTDSTKYILPTDKEGFVVTCNGSVYNDYNYTSSGIFTINNVKDDISVTAVADEKGPTPPSTYTVTCMPAENIGYDCKASVMPGEKLEITITIPSTGKYALEKADVKININNTPYTDFSFEKPSDFTRKVTIGEGVINGPVTIAAKTYIPTKKYTVTFAVEHAIKGADFPTEMNEGAGLTATFYAETGHRLPIQDGTPDCEEFSIWKVGDGTNIALEPFKKTATGWTGDYIYSVETDGDGNQYAKIDIFPLTIMGGQLSEVKIIGKAVPQVTVTFKPGDNAHWSDGTGTNPKYGTIDKGKTFLDAKEAMGNFTPVYNIEGYEIDKWLGEDGTTEYNNLTVIDSAVTVHTTFKMLEFYFHTEDVHHANFAGLPEVIHLHDPIGTNPIKKVTIAADGGYKLPAKSDVEVEMAVTGGMIPIEFSYNLNTENTVAEFSIAGGIIEGDVSVRLSAFKNVSITFDPGVGTWPNSMLHGPLTATVPENSTYQFAFDKLNTRGNPKVSGLGFAGWKYDNAYIDMNTIIPVDGITVVADFSTESSFSYDSWGNVIEHVKNGDLVETYKETLYLGAERTVNYVDPITNGTKTYHVQVIDSEHDMYMEGSTKKKSSLTFEFVELVGEGMYGRNSEGQASNNWKDSEYRKYLATFYENITRNTPGFVTKAALKSTLQGEQGDPTPDYPIVLEDHLFPLSGFEIGLAPQNNDSVNKTTYKAGRNEGYATYFDYLSGGRSRLKSLYGESDYKQYWLRSPHVYKEPEEDDVDIYDDGCAYCIKKTGGTSADYQGSYQVADTHVYGYMAAFCI